MWRGQIRPMRFLLFTMLYIMSQPILASMPAGIVTKIKGEAMRSFSDGIQEEALKEGSIVYSGDSIITTSKSFIRLTFKDETIVNLAGDTTFIIRKFDFDPNIKRRETIYGLLKGKMRSLIQQKVEDGQKVKFQGKTLTFGVRGTEILANAYKAAKKPVNDLAIVEGNVSTKMNAGQSYQMGQGQYINSSTVASQGVQTMPAKILKALKSGSNTFFPKLMDPSGMMVPLDKAFKAIGLGAAAAGLVSGLTNTLLASSDEQQEDKKPPVEKASTKSEIIKETKEEAFSYLPTHNGEKLDLIKEPEDIRYVVQNYVELKSEGRCFYWFYKSLPGDGKKERFRRERDCDEFEFDD